MEDIKTDSIEDGPESKAVPKLFAVISTLMILIGIWLWSPFTPINIEIDTWLYSSIWFNGGLAVFAGLFILTFGRLSRLVGALIVFGLISTSSVITHVLEVVSQKSTWDLQFLALTSMPFSAILLVASVLFIIAAYTPIEELRKASEDDKL